MFKARGILPSQLAVQSPLLLFKMLNFSEDEQDAEIPDSLRFLYGY
ncbi:MAG: hypothetical protein PUF72_01570 [Clostridiales bacterium]|nr:hypothetical protein [Clostridiales bacterium]